MTTCGAIGALTVGGREVAAFRCELDAGHDRERWDFFKLGIIDAEGYAAHNRAGGGPLARLDPTPHRYTLTWAEDDALMLPDAELFDPDEKLVDVPMPEHDHAKCCPVETCVREQGHEGVHDDLTP